MLDKKTICVITGASKGLGKCIVEKLFLRLPAGSCFILMARSSKLLEEVSTIASSRDGIKAVTVVFDQGSVDQETFDNCLLEGLKKLDIDTPLRLTPGTFEQAMLINNAGCLEPLDFVKDLDDVSAISSYFNVNLTGYVTITSKFLQVFNNSVIDRRLIVNISSLGAIQPMKSWSLYCMGKAARDMLMKAVAAEEEKVRTLNYAPGPLRTEMTQIASKSTKDQVLKDWFIDQVSGQKLLECETTTEKLLQILEKDTFENGAHIDYYDEM